MRQLEIMHHDGTTTFWPLPDGARWRADPYLGIIYYAGPGSGRTHIPWQSIKYYHVHTAKEQHERQPDEQPRHRTDVCGICPPGGHYARLREARNRRPMG